MTLNKYIIAGTVLAAVLAGLLFRFSWLPAHDKQVAAKQQLQTLVKKETVLQADQKVIQQTTANGVKAVATVRAKAKTAPQQVKYVDDNTGLNISQPVPDAPDVTMPVASLPKLADLVADDKTVHVELTGSQQEVTNVTAQLSNCNDQKKSIKQVLKDKHTWLKIGIGVGIGSVIGWKVKK
jgi:hypothetical protein